MGGSEGITGNATVTAKFLYEHIWCHFGCPIELINNQGSHFLNTDIHDLTEHYVMVHKKSTSYYPHANGLAESMNKTLQNILKKIVNENRIDWDTNLHNALWAYRTSFKSCIQSTPFRLVFRLEAVMLVEFQLPSLHIHVREHLSKGQPEQIRLQQLLELG
mgnify:CR=1 FL=1